MDKFYNSRRDILTVLEIQDDMSRVFKLIYTVFLGLVAVLISVLAVMSLWYPLFTMSNDYEYTWDITGSMFLSGVTVNGTAVTTFNPLMLVFYVLAGVAAIVSVVYVVANIVHAVRTKDRTPYILPTKPRRRFKFIIGVCLMYDAAVLLLFEAVFSVTKTSEGAALMEEMSANFSFNNNPTALSALLTAGVFLIGSYFLFSSLKTSKLWREHQGLVYLLGIVALLLYFWQYGYLHQLFGIDPSTSSFPYPFPKAVNSFSNFTGGVKGAYNSVFGSLVSVFVHGSSTILNDSVLYNSITTVTAMLLGFAAGGFIGYIIAVVAASRPKWGKGVLTICTILVSFPVVALAPIVNHWFPSNSYLLSWVAKVIVVTILCMAGMSINAYKGLTVMKPFALDLMEICNADKKTTLRTLRIPNSLPNVFTALKINSATALMGAFVCEFYSLSKNLGIGMMFNNYWDTARYQAWAYIIMAIVYGLILYIIVSVIESKMLGWYALAKKK